MASKLKFGYLALRSNVCTKPYSKWDKLFVSLLSTLSSHIKIFKIQFSLSFCKYVQNLNNLLAATKASDFFMAYQIRASR